MATPPTFSAGAVLTAAQMNQLGLFLVKSEPIVGTPSSVTVSDAFTADFDNYRVILSGGTNSAICNLRLQLGARTSGYYGFAVYGTFAGTTVFGINDSNQSLFRYISGGDTTSIQAVFDLTDAYPARATSIMSTLQNGTSMGYYTGRNANSESYTDFTLSVDSGSLSGGTVRVYGYRK
jgi:hypothetical protein